MKPELRSFDSLGPADFQNHPVWIRIRSFDFNEPWYDDSGDETFRFWEGQLPFDEPRGMVLVFARLRFNDGTIHQGFISPARRNWDAPLPPKRVGNRSFQLSTPKDRHGGSQLAILGIQQPRIFLPHGTFGFWGGMPGISEDTRKAFYAAAGKSPQDIFPIEFSADHRLAEGIVSGKLDGFYRSILGNPPECSW